MIIQVQIDKYQGALLTIFELCVLKCMLSNKDFLTWLLVLISSTLWAFIEWRPVGVTKHFFNSHGFNIGDAAAFLLHLFLLIDHKYKGYIT